MRKHHNLHWYALSAPEQIHNAQTILSEIFFILPNGSDQIFKCGEHFVIVYNHDHMSHVCLGSCKISNWITWFYSMKHMFFEVFFTWLKLGETDWYTKHRRTKLGCGHWYAVPLPRGNNKALISFNWQAVYFMEQQNRFWPWHGGV